MSKFRAASANTPHLSVPTLQLFRANAEGALAPPGVFGITHLGYPILAILGVWKILGVVAVLIHKFPLPKEWAHAGFFFAMTGAAFSHTAVGDPVKELVPSLLLLVLTVVSWYFRPAGRKIPTLTHSRGPRNRCSTGDAGSTEIINARPT